MSEQRPKSIPVRRAEPWVLAFACGLPALVTYAYFELASGAPAAVQQAVYAVGKIVQFGLPVVWVGLVAGERLAWGRWARRGVGLGVAFGGLVAGVAWIAFDVWLRDAPFFQPAMAEMIAKVGDLGINDPRVFAAVGVFYALCHSLMEEYYWRWFVFRRMCPITGLSPAIAISSAAFMTHHVLVLHRYFHATPLATAGFSLAVMIGGAFWAWLYGRSNSLLGPWLSHLLIDAVIFAIGYAIVFNAA